jgi:cytochrome c
MFTLENTKKLKTALLGASFASLFASSALAAQLTYTVQPGDTVGNIVKKLGLKSIEAANITVPSGNLAVIKPGEKITYTPSYAIAVDGAVKYPDNNGMYTAYYLPDYSQKIGAYRAATQNEVNAWNIDVMPDGTGAPEFDMHRGVPVKDENGNPKKAEGSVERGGELYDEQCAMCHGEFGAGGKGYPTLAGGSKKSLTTQRLNPADEHPNPDGPVKTIGSYWPYASTLFWYIQDAMPFPHPKSLSNSDTYAITAYLLSVNSIKIDGEELTDEYVLDREKFLKIKMPNEDGFYPQVDTPNDPKQGVRNMTNYLANPENYGKGTRCMTDCIKEPVEDLLMRVGTDLAATASQPISTVRDLPVEKNAGPVHPGQALYDANGCAGCHANAAIGAPVVGDKEAWHAVLEKGIDAVYANGINGINAMPPKGGTGVSDDEFKQMVDYMIEASK